MSYVEKEREIIQFWKENKIFEKSVLQRPEDNPYVFYDGPPFATGLPHYGHILSFVTKDVFPRYWTMKNYRCERKWGWDCHGLPIESICERELDIKQKKEIYQMGIDTFNEFCRSKVLWYTNEWKNTVERMGKWIEFDNAYKTMDNTYMESVWAIFKKIYTNGMVYRSKKVLLYCPRCETPLSNFEISMDNSYQDVTEKSITAKFKLLNEPNTYLLAWTTTPWTLIGNVTLAVNGEKNYVKILLSNGKEQEEFLILMEDRLHIITVDYEIVDTFEGKVLVNEAYEPLYKFPLETDKKGHYVVNGGDNVLSDEGTGIIHMAIYGELDFEMITKYDMPIIQHLNGQGNLEKGPKNWIGSWFKDVDKKVLKDLEERGLLYDAEDYTHSYPFCYRCDTPLIYNALDAWFIDIQHIKPSLLKTNEQINWYPKEIDKRFRTIIETAPDWCISRNRFWATAIPLWECSSCNNIRVIGSIEELQASANESVPDDLDLHKHVVDKIHIECENCGTTMTRIPEVFDCWLESGSMPFATKHYPFENIEWFKTNFPSDFVSEYIGQVRAWFYYMHVISNLLMGDIPFKNVVVNGNILAEDGSKMSKSRRNFPDPNLIIERYGADALRIYLLSSQLMRSQDLNFKEDIVKQVYRRFNLLLINVLKFYSMFEINEDDSKASDSNVVLDRWIISSLNVLTKEVTHRMDDYDTAEVSRKFFTFVEDLSTWYLKNSRNRFKSENLLEKSQAMNTLSLVLSTLSKLLAPITPFISEVIYQKLKEKGMVNAESVHLEQWPEHDEKKVDLDLNNKMQLTREIVSKALDLRDKAKIPVRQVLYKVTIKGIKLEDEFLHLIANVLNVKQAVTMKTVENQLDIELDTVITKDLKLEGLSRNLIRHLNNYRKKLGLSTKDRIMLSLSSGDTEINEAIQLYSNDIKRLTQADALRMDIEEGMQFETIKISESVVKAAIVLKKEI